MILYIIYHILYIIYYILHIPYYILHITYYIFYILYSYTMYPRIPIKNSDVFITPTYGDRLDILANEYYNDSSLWWIIAKANNLDSAHIGLDVNKQVYNINGDTAANAIAKKLRSRRLLLMTNVEGVYDDQKQLTYVLPTDDLDSEEKESYC